MIRGLIDFAGPWGTTLIIVLLGLGLLFVAIRSGGGRNDLSGGIRWQVWLVAGLALVALIFFLSRSVGSMRYVTCSDVAMSANPC